MMCESDACCGYRPRNTAKSVKDNKTPFNSSSKTGSKTVVYTKCAYII